MGNLVAATCALLLGTSPATAPARPLQPPVRKEQSAPRSPVEAPGLRLGLTLPEFARRFASLEVTSPSPGVRRLELARMPGEDGLERITCDFEGGVLVGLALTYVPGRPAQVPRWIGALAGPRTISSSTRRVQEWSDRETTLRLVEELLKPVPQWRLEFARPGGPEVAATQASAAPENASGTRRPLGVSLAAPSNAPAPAPEPAPVPAPATVPGGPATAAPAVVERPAFRLEFPEAPGLYLGMPLAEFFRKASASELDGRITGLRRYALNQDSLLPWADSVEAEFADERLVTLVVTMKPAHAFAASPARSLAFRAPPGSRRIAQWKDFSGTPAFEQHFISDAEGYATDQVVVALLRESSWGATRDRFVLYDARWFTRLQEKGFISGPPRHSLNYSLEVSPSLSNSLFSTPSHVAITLQYTRALAPALALELGPEFIPWSFTASLAPFSGPFLGARAGLQLFPFSREAPDGLFLSAGLRATVGLGTGTPTQLDALLGLGLTQWTFARTTWSLRLGLNINPSRELLPVIGTFEIVGGHAL